MKKITLALLGLLLVLTLVACGSSSDTSKTQETDESAAAETMVYDSSEESTDTIEDTDTDTENDKDGSVTSESCVVYFSGTGNTRSIAEMLAEVTGSDLYEIVPAEVYTDDDLNYNDDDCRANKEQDDPAARPAIENDLSAVTGYGTIYLGHPIWWGTNPRIIQTFLDTYDLSNVKIYTFCTSGGSGIEQSISDLQANYPDLNIISGKRLNNATEKDIEDWISGLE